MVKKLQHQQNSIYQALLSLSPPPPWEPGDKATILVGYIYLAQKPQVDFMTFSTSLLVALIALEPTLESIILTHYIDPPAWYKFPCLLIHFHCSKIIIGGASAAIVRSSRL